MIIHRLYLGTWLPRTAIHLKEVFNFLNSVEGVRGLNQKKLNELHKNLGVTNVIFSQELDLDSLEGVFTDGSFLFTEDGILLLKSGRTNITALEEFNNLRDFLLNFSKTKLGPTLNYLFSLGAPIPRDLAEPKTVLPFIAIVSEAGEAGIKKIYDIIGERQRSVISLPEIEIHRSLSLTVIYPKNQEIDFKKLDSLIQHDVFFREFEFQLEDYLLLHRKYWNEVAHIRESRVMKYKDFPAIRRQLLDIRQSFIYVQARLLQMKDILDERVRTIVKEDANFLDELGLDRFAILESAHAYIDHLWKMTSESLEGTMTIFQTLYEENTQRELAVIKVTTFATALTGFFGMNIGFPWEERWSAVKSDSFVVALLVVFGSISFYFILKQALLKRRFFIGRDKEL